MKLLTDDEMWNSMIMDSLSDLLLLDLCARIPYGVMVHVEGVFREDLDARLDYIDFSNRVHLCGYNFGFRISAEEHVKPYLRPMSSMTQEEKDHFEFGLTYNGDITDQVEHSRMLIDWLNEHLFDYRGLIDMGLALEAPDEMYNF